MTLLLILTAGYLGFVAYAGRTSMHSVGVVAVALLGGGVLAPVVTRLTTWMVAVRRAHGPSTRSCPGCGLRPSAAFPGLPAGGLRDAWMEGLALSGSLLLVVGLTTGWRGLRGQDPADTAADGLASGLVVALVYWGGAQAWSQLSEVEAPSGCGRCNSLRLPSSWRSSSRPPRACGVRRGRCSWQPSRSWALPRRASSSPRIPGPRSATPLSTRFSGARSIHRRSQPKTVLRVILASPVPSERRSATTYGYWNALKVRFNHRGRARTGKWSSGGRTSDLRVPAPSGIEG